MRKLLAIVAGLLFSGAAVAEQVQYLFTPSAWRQDVASGGLTWYLSNESAAAGAFAVWEVRNGPSAADAIRMGILGTGFTTTGPFVQDGAFIDANVNLSGGLSFAARHASAPIRFYTGGSNLRGTILSSGALDWDTPIQGVDYQIGTTATAPTITYVGDSLTVGTGGTNPYNFYITLSTWNGQSLTSTNIGVGGRTVATMYDQAWTNLYPIAARNSALNVAVIWGGSNDVTQGGTPQQAYSSLRALCQHARALGYRVVTATMISRIGQDANKNTLNALIRPNWPTFADAMVDLAANADLGADNAYQNTTYFNADGAHLTDTGYALVGSLMQTGINSLIGADAKSNLAAIMKAVGPSPAVSSCGTGAALDALATNTAGLVTEGTVATGCVVEFNPDFSTAPRCIVTSRAGLGFSYTTSVSELTITNVGALSSTALDYHCFE